MTQPTLGTLPAYNDTRDAIVHVMGLAERLRLVAPFSSDEESDYQRLSMILNKSTRQLRALAVCALQLIDETIAQSQLVDRLNDQARTANAEAQRIAVAAAEIDEIVGVLDDITSLVTSVTGLGLSI